MSIPDTTTLERMRQQLRYYDAGNGALIWLQGSKEGELAGSETTTHNPELRVRINGQSFLAAKIAWYLSMGYWPVNRLRFLNGDRTDIRMENLEETDRIDGPGR